ncbi:MAG TPA: glycoside hydrolase family 3 protein [Hungateiclostridium thermocellum]|jgi:beta-N-acetylhexosaminidase|uniref:beta-N-acetylhexosaminidase n=2 Tax=Acetivibrio thermocellus TaxID=1515 RepID=A3DC81_ACET2|nr:glycoside hydrolase family 3 protein [Acetivibrio thermocellus]CDG34998.1 glycoside hydrolase family protein [Acetivibrio thermocellus BC1]ABN51560.1 glycoside hydrolase family 3 domain protein [Acetivibrio thermocellus ATCC 27405]ADU74955.1 glycoside hydrolase family 3 domain protein [Acetivibrio thermocellus DSM 1313]ALX08916.1 Beta-N-acetylhexosaminidase [Acetivibrio thermocellus AD2]ANV76666.1 Beta-N-acetylhexosaminidase [Acetivibrio thermocellus DSM 2360]
MKKRVHILIMTLMLIVACVGCSGSSDNPPPANSLHSASTIPISAMPSFSTPSPTVEDTENQQSKTVNYLINSMTLEEKIGQIFIVAFRKGKSSRPLKVLDNSTKLKIQNFNPGGIILFSENIDTIPQTQKLIRDMQEASKIPMFIAVDEEGGRIARIGNNPKMHSTKIPSAQTIGLADDPELAYEAGRILGAELSALGFNMNFAPVADVNTNPDNPVIGDRSFGSDPYKVGLMVQAMSKGMQEQNVCTVLKHFPGHGDTSYDSHLGQVVINHDIERLRQIELTPFKMGIKAGADGVMTAHIIMPNITGSNLPATLSEEILSGLLRNELKHEKLIITDAMEMKAISNYWSSSKAAVMAFKAGADIILMPESFEEAYNGILKAVKDGEITEERLNQSLQRILALKFERNILANKESSVDPEKVLGRQEHTDIVVKIMQKAEEQNIP